ncbi:MAG: helix-turn-helix transcriptional regulator [Lacunisphaera sp.]
MAKRLLARVKDIRETLGLSQEAFAERAGLAYKYYQHVEAGRKRDIRLSTLEKLAKACGLEPSELLDFKTDPVVLTEDRAKDGFKATARRPAKRRSGEKGS